MFEEFALLQRDAATEFNLRRALPGRTYLHLATHGLVSQQRRSLFSALALTAPPDMEQGSLNDGFLQLYEVYDLDLKGTQLAVLSACRTNVGSKVSNDGVFALSRGFLAAGVPRVVASQWSVDDDSTAELIGSFFDQIAAARRAGEPLDYARFLREAKRRVRRQEGWRSPYHWAPFVLIGAR